MSLKKSNEKVSCAVQFAVTSVIISGMPLYAYSSSKSSGETFERRLTSDIPLQKLHLSGGRKANDN